MLCCDVKVESEYCQISDSLENQIPHIASRISLRNKKSSGMQTINRQALMLVKYSLPVKNHFIIVQCTKFW